MRGKYMSTKTYPKKTDKNFSVDFKKTIVKQYFYGAKVNYLSKEYNVSKVTIYNWIKKYPLDVENEIEIEGASPKNVKSLINENELLRQELDILKKAMMIIAKK
jgi:transposase